ncbi:hypothetical protein ACCS93_38870 [Rhizobium ruizarguesonis]
MKLWRMFSLPILVRWIVFIFWGLRVAGYRFHRLVHPGGDGVDVFAQILDDGVPVLASRQITDDTIDDCLQIAGRPAQKAVFAEMRLKSRI